ncbi:MAG: biopolymer transporter ExbD [Planctomycetes bacterium]|nr:biopolymer transporter ExbD [Planctomycetota bacterium]
MNHWTIRISILRLFFMISTTFTRDEYQTDIQLPTVAESSVLSGQPDKIVVNVSVAGEMKVNGTLQSSETLTTLLRKAVTAYPGQAVEIRGDGRCEYQRVMDAFSACKLAGVKNLQVSHLSKQEIR